MIVPILIILAPLLKASTYIISQQFFTNQFTNNDCNVWTITGPTLPQMLFSNCSSNRIFGGYNVFTGDATNPTRISRSWINLIPHYNVRITAKIYKIDSWPNNTLFVRVDATTVRTLTFNSSNPGSADICGNPSPILDSVNTNYNEQIVVLDVTVAHSATTLMVEFISNLIGTTGAWGIRELSVTMGACDESCQSCTNQTACVTCNTASGLVLSGPFCICSVGIRQKVIPCTLYPCASCVSPTCSAGYYLSTTTTYCQPCNVACSVCTSPTNSVTTCTICASGFVNNPTAGVLCSSCFSGCKTCSSTAANTCSSCLYQYFFYSTNNSCLSSCPAGFYGQEKTAICYSCLSPCVTCVGASASPYFCTSCVSGYYLWEYSCLTACPNAMFGYLGNCISTCPQTTLANIATYTCLPCVSNCLECSTTTYCSICASNAYLLLGLCYLSCSIGYYGDASSRLCLSCDVSCLTCNGPLATNCLSCNTGAVLVSGVCYTSCPINTYSLACLPCDSSCLACSGGLPSNCISCVSPNFYHLNDSTCLSECHSGQLANNYNFTCSRCLAGYVAYYNACVTCDPSCLTCSGIYFLDCTSCNSHSSLINSACVTLSNGKIIYVPDVSSSSVEQTVTTLLIIYILTSIVVELMFQYKTNLLPTVQLLQILSYTYYLSIKLTQNSQKTALVLYLVNFAAYLKPFRWQVSASLPAKFQVMGKTGYFFIDSAGVHICMIAVVVVHFAAKYLGGKFNAMLKLYKKLNPYLISYTFRLVTLELALDLVLYLFCFEVSSPVGGASLALLLLDIGLIIAGSCWRIKTALDGSQVALFYNNQIGQPLPSRQEGYQEKEQNTTSVQSKIKKNKVLPSVLTLLAKLPVPITILFFIGNSSTQSICYLVFFLFNLILSLLVPYRRKIYRVIIISGCLALVINGIIAVTVSSGANSYAFDVLWIIVIVLSLCLTVMQVVVNYQYFFMFASFFWHNLKKVCEEEQTKQEKNEASQSNLTECEANDESRAKKSKASNIFQQDKEFHISEEEPRADSKNMRSNNKSSYLHLANFSQKFEPQNDVQLDLNL